MKTKNVSTNGWDTIYALPFELVNKAIISHSSSPTSFNELEAGDTPYEFKGDFGPWQLTTGGDGAAVLMAVPLKNISLTVGTSNFTHPEIIANIQINLKWLADESGDIQSLNIDNENYNNRIKVIGFDLEGLNLSTAVIGIAENLLHNWLLKNASSFSHIFASVNINQSVDKDAYEWMMPTTVAYAVSDGGDATDITKSVFAVLCMTEGRQAPGAAQIQGDIIQAGANSIYLISESRVLDKFFLPTVPHLFKDASNSDFYISDNAIKNKNALTFDKVKDEDDKDREFNLPAEGFLFELNQELIRMDMTDLNFTYSPGISVHMNYRSQGQITVPKGEMKLLITPLPVDVSVEVSTGVDVAEILGGIAISLVLGAIGGIVGAALEGGGAAGAQVGQNVVQNGVANGIAMAPLGGGAVAANGIAPAAGVANVAQGAINAAAGQAPGRIATFFAENWIKMLCGAIGMIIGGGSIPAMWLGLKALANDDAPSMEDFGKATMSPISWPGMSNTEFTFVDGHLNGSLQLQLNISELSPPTGS